MGASGPLRFTSSQEELLPYHTIHCITYRLTSSQEELLPYHNILIVCNDSLRICGPVLCSSRRRDAIR
eukprot:6201466-Pleurochrysis_carterae.AAC.4